MQKKLPKVILIDDYPLYRKAMSDVLTNSGEFQVIGQTGDAKVASALVALVPDLVVMALEVETYDAMELLCSIKENHPGIKVVLIMNSANQSELLLKALRQDANGYLLRTIEPVEFVDQLNKAVTGGMASSEKITSVLAELLRGRTQIREDQRSLQLLTERETDVLECIAMGMSNKEISEALQIRDGTVKVHVKHVLKKLNFRSRVEVAVWASEQGYSRKGSRVRRR